MALHSHGHSLFQLFVEWVCMEQHSGVAQWLACWAHNPKVRGSKPRSATFYSAVSASSQTCLHAAGLPIELALDAPRDAVGPQPHVAFVQPVGAQLLCLLAMVVKPFAPGQVLLCMWTALLNQTSGPQGYCGVSCGILAGSDPGTGSGWQQSRPNRTPLCSDETQSLNATAAPLARSCGV